MQHTKISDANISIFAGSNYSVPGEYEAHSANRWRVNADLVLELSSCVVPDENLTVPRRGYYVDLMTSTPKGNHIYTIT